MSEPRIVALLPDGTLPVRVENRIKALAAASTEVGAHHHSAADITSGIVDPQRLGSGVPSTSNFLRGDSAWAEPHEDLPDLSLQFENGLV